jgi:hypothetical protein
MVEASNDVRVGQLWRCNGLELYLILKTNATWTRVLCLDDANVEQIVTSLIMRDDEWFQRVA